LPLSKNDIKFIRSLQQKKFRDQHQKFIVEGVKLVKELLNSDWIEEIEHVYKLENCSITIPQNMACSVVSKSELERISHFKSPNEVLVVVKMKTLDEIEFEAGQVIIALDNVRDPGNLGTIIRTTDWFGNQQILCSEETVDCYNPKVIQSSMGAFFRVRCHYVKLEEQLSKFQSEGFTIYGAEMDGASVYETQPQKKSVLLMGSESHGISNHLRSYFESLTIPKFGQTESLNVAMATGIILSEFKRKLTIDQ